MHIRRTTLEDLPVLEQLMNAVWQNEPGARAYYGWGHRPGLLAELEGQVVGYGCLWHSALHTTYTYLGVHVHPDFRQQGIGSALWARLTTQVNNPLKCKTFASQSQSVAFLNQQGLKLTVQTHEPVLNLALLVDAQVQQWADEAMARGVELFPLTPPLLSDLRTELTHLHETVYAHTHLHDPMTLGVLDADDFLGADLNPAWLWLARTDARLVGVSSVRLTDEPGEAEVGWFGVPQVFAEGGGILTLALTGLALQAAARDGIKRVTGELDSTDSSAMLLLTELPWQPDKLWLTFTSG